MKLFKVFLIVIFIFSLVVSVSMFIPLKYFSPIYILFNIDSLIAPKSLGLAIFLSFGYFYTPLLALSSLSLLAFLNAKESGSKIWYRISIISFIIFCLLVVKFTFDLRTRIINNSDISPPPSLPIIKS